MEESQIDFFSRMFDAQDKTKAMIEYLETHPGIEFRACEDDPSLMTFATGCVYMSYRIDENGGVTNPYFMNDEIPYMTTGDVLERIDKELAHLAHN